MFFFLIITSINLSLSRYDFFFKKKTKSFVTTEKKHKCLGLV